MIGGIKLECETPIRFPGTKSSNTKVQVNNITLETKMGTSLCTIDIKDFFLISPMPLAKKCIYPYIKNILRQN